MYEFATYFLSAFEERRFSFDPTEEDESSRFGELEELRLSLSPFFFLFDDVVSLPDVL